jgi:hypothetical protein
MGVAALSQFGFCECRSQVQGALVIARPVNNPATAEDESRSVAISALSGDRFTGNPGQPFSADYASCTDPEDPACESGFWGRNTAGSSFGSRDPELNGYYEIPVPAGEYTIEVRNITQSEGIGSVTPPFFLPGPSEFWNQDESASDESADDPGFSYATARKDTVVVPAGAVISGKDIILNNTPPTYDQFEQPKTSPASPAISTSASAGARN